MRSQFSNGTPTASFILGQKSVTRSNYRQTYALMATMSSPGASGCLTGSSPLIDLVSGRYDLVMDEWHALGWTDVHLCRQRVMYHEMNDRILQYNLVEDTTLARRESIEERRVQDDNFAWNLHLCIEFSLGDILKRRHRRHMQFRAHSWHPQSTRKQLHYRRRLLAQGASMVPSQLRPYAVQRSTCHAMLWYL